MIECVKTAKERLEWLIAQKRLNPSKLSTQAGLARGHVGLFLKGNIKSLSDDVATKLAQVTGASASWLITGDGDPWTADPSAVVPCAPAAASDPVAHHSMLAALSTAFRAHPTATIEDLDAVRSLVTAGHARLIPAEHAAAILGAWLDGAHSIRTAGETVTIDALGRYLSNLPPTPARVQH